MSGPGKGRYGNYHVAATARNKLLAGLFNEKAPGGKGEIYGSAYPTDRAAALKAVIDRATAPVVDGVGGLIPSDGKQVGDPDMFPGGVLFGFGGAPKMADVETSTATKPGNPANPYMPNIASPGPGKFQHDVPTTIPVDELAKSIEHLAGYTAGAPGTGTTSPDVTSKKLGDPASVGLGADLTPGKSAV